MATLRSLGKLFLELSNEEKLQLILGVRYNRRREAAIKSKLPSKRAKKVSEGIPKKLSQEMTVKLLELLTQHRRKDG